MYDTVNWRFDTFSIPNTDILGEITQFIDVESTKYSEKTGITSVYGNVRNYKVSLSEVRVSLWGSLSKFYYQDDLASLNLKDSRLAVEKLSDTLHLPFEKAKVGRLDVGKNIETNFPALAYLKYLGGDRYLKRNKVFDSLYYRGNVKEMVFYDKLQQLKKEKREIPIEFEGKNLLRCELRYMKNVSKQLKHNVTGELLFNERFYNALAINWLTHYERIEKLNPIELNFDLSKHPSKFFELLAVAFIDNNLGGLNGLNEMVEEMRMRNIFPVPAHYSRIKAMAKNKYESIPQPLQKPLIDELNQKVEKAYKENKFV